MTVEKDLELAPEQADTPVPESQTASESPEPKPEPEKTFTQAELDAIVQKRVAKASRQAERDDLRRQIEELRSQIQRPAPKQEDPAPKRESFEDYEAFVAAQVEHKARAIAREELANAERSRQQREEAQKRVAAEKAFAKRMEEARAEIDDFDDALQNLDVSFPDGFMDAIKESDLGPKVAYYLATHRDDADRIAGMSKTGAIREVGRLEAKLSAPAKQTNAPAPLKPVSGSSAAPKYDPHGDDDDMEKYRKWREGHR